MSLFTRNMVNLRNFSKLTRNLGDSKIIHTKKMCEKLTEKSEKFEKAGHAVKNGDVPGLSTKVVEVPADESVGPGASKTATYKNPEYYCYNRTSYFEAEVEMSKYRCPQPSVDRYYEQKAPK